MLRLRLAIDLIDEQRSFLAASLGTVPRNRTESFPEGGSHHPSAMLFSSRLWVLMGVLRHMRTRTVSACVGLALAWSAACFAEPQLAASADGKAMLERAMAALKANEAAALKAFNDEKNKDFRDRDLYVYCFSLPREYHRLPKPGHDRHQRQRVEGSSEQSRLPTRLRRGCKGRRRWRLSALPTISQSGTKAPAPKECGVNYFKGHKGRR